jgi:hypothetical protein
MTELESEIGVVRIVDGSQAVLATTDSVYAVLSRSDPMEEPMTADDLLDAIRATVREEIARLHDH